MKQTNPMEALLAILLVYSSNFHVMHWKAKGEHFHTIHDQANKYYTMLLEDSDDVAEILLRDGKGNCLNYTEALTVLKENELEDFVLSSKDNYNIEKFVNRTDKMFKDVLFTISACLELEEKLNPGVKSYLENLYNEYDKQCNYINFQRRE